MPVENLNLIYSLAMKRPRIAKARMAAGLFSKRGSLLSVGFNSLKTHPKAQEWHKKSGKYSQGSCLHAEMDAIIKSSDNIPEKSYMIVARAKKPEPGYPGYVMGMAMPCMACLNALSETRGIARVIFSINDPSPLSETIPYGEIRL